MSATPFEHNSMPPPGLCTAVVLAGGAGRRMDGRDKGLLPWHGTTLAGHAAARLAALGLPVLISANRNLDEYQAYGHPLLQDRRPDYAGPLAAIEAALLAAPTPWVLTVPCDSPFFPDDLPARLWVALHAGTTGAGAARADAAYVRCGAQSHPVFSLVATRLAAPLGRYLEDGGRRVHDWWQAAGALSVDFGSAAADNFANANTADELARLRGRDQRSG